jgi:hypothetical protein
MSNEEAASLRRAIYDKGAPDRTDLVGLLSLAADVDDAELFALVADVARDALLGDGRLTSPDADWLMEVCGDGHGLESYAQFEALTSVLRNAAPAPAELVAFAAREIERAILTGERAYIGGESGDPGCVRSSDLAALRDICSAARPDRALAEVLFDIAHATATADNDPGFDVFFAKTMRSYVGSDARLDAFLAAMEEGPAPEAPRPAAVDGLADARYLEVAEATSARFEAAARLPAPETRWVAAQLSRGALSPAERRLLAALRDPARALDRAA